MIVPVILSGGSGSRLWPLSRQQFPKQFLSIIEESTLLQSTVKRLDDLDYQELIIVSRKNYKSLISQQLEEIKVNAKIILEPEGKNTAPAVTLAAYTVSVKDDPLLLVLSADHFIENSEEFLETIRTAIPFAENGQLVTFGVTPTSPFTGYGYIKKGVEIKGSPAYKIQAFKEKPTQKIAEDYLLTGNYLWNSGMFLFKASTFLNELEGFEPEIINACRNVLQDPINPDDNVEIDATRFSRCPNKSIDYAVMEKTKKGVVIPLHCGWSDIGTWGMIWEMQDKDKNNNVILNDVIIEDSKNCLVRSYNKLIAATGIENLIIVDTKDALLVASKDNPESIQKLITNLQKNNRTELINYDKTSCSHEEFELGKK